MKKIVTVMLLYSIVAPAAFAATEPANTTGNVGINYGMYNVFGIQEELNISSLANNKPVSVQIFLKHYLQSIGPNITWDTTGIGATTLYDFSSVAKMDEKIHPYGGIGLMAVYHSWKGAGPVPGYTGVPSGLYLTGGVRYDLTDQVMADLNYNVLGDLTVGIEFKF